ncbi:MAG: TlpA disulfide reductase family protein [Pseudomonadota bacterium]
MLLLVWSASASAEQLLAPWKGQQPAPDFELVDMDGARHRLSDYRGKPVIINFWATWCPPCRAEMPSMNRGWHKVKEEVVMLAVNVGEDEDKIFVFGADYPIDFPILLDQSGDVIKQWPVKGLPTTFVLDRVGNIRYIAVGAREWDDDALLELVKGL